MKPSGTQRLRFRLGYASRVRAGPPAALGPAVLGAQGAEQEQEQEQDQTERGINRTGSSSLAKGNCNFTGNLASTIYSNLLQ